MRFCKEYDFNGIKGFKLGWSLFGPPLMTTYCYTLNDLMIDTGQSHMQKEVLEIAKDHRIEKVFLTHHHEDHSGNAAAIKINYGAIIYGHVLTKEKMKTSFQILPYQKYIWGKAAPLAIELFPKTIETSFGEMVPVHTPGHAKDHTAFFLKDAGVLFSGDLFLADKIKFFRSDEEINTQILSLKKILKLDFNTLLCNHHPQLKNGKTRIKNKLEFLEELEGNIIRFYKKGCSAKQIFRALRLKEDYFTKYFCFGNVSMLNGVKSVVLHYETMRNGE